MRKSYVYKITCKINDEFYFGSSFNAKSDKYWGSGRRIKERIAQYGKENFVKEILEEFDDRVEAHKVENEYIEKFRNDDKCLNQMLNRHFGSFSEEIRTKIGAAQRGEKSSWYGKHFSEEHRTRIGAANAISLRGKHLSEEHRSRISAGLCGNTNVLGKHWTEEHRAKIGAAKRGEKNPNFGKHLSEETRAKLSAANRGDKNPMYGKHWRKNTVTGKREYYD